MKRADDLKLATLTLVMIPVIALTGALRGPSADLPEAPSVRLMSEPIQSPQAGALADEPRQSTKPSGVTSEDIETLQISPVSFGDVQRVPVTSPAAETVQSPQMAAMAPEAQKNTESPRAIVKDLDSPALAPSTVVEPLPPVGPNAHMGICNVVDPTSPYDPNASTRYTEAKNAGATLTRWALYWGEVKSVGYEAKYDATVKQNLKNGLEVLIVLLDPPNPPGDLEAWASFVSETVERYKPGGKLSREDPDWPQGKGVRYWEVWNEQNYSFFWTGGGLKRNMQSYLRSRIRQPRSLIQTALC